MSENQRLKELQKTLNFSSQEKFAKVLGIKQGSLSDIYRMKSGIKVSDSIKRKLETEYSINIKWLESGIGSVFINKTDKFENNVLADRNELYGITQNDCEGVPYYDVDFIGGFDLIENDQSMKPAFYINFPNYNDADAWVNITGHSMHPLISHGDIMSIKQLPDWEINLLYGEIYAVVTDNYRTVKKIRKSSLGSDFIRLVPINTAEYDEQDIPKTIIRKVFQVFVTAKKLF